MHHKTMKEENVDAEWAYNMWKVVAALPKKKELCTQNFAQKFASFAEWDEQLHTERARATYARV